MTNKNNIVVITGVSSFIGANLAIYLAKQGYKVYGTVSSSIENYNDVRKLRLDHVISAGAGLRELNLINTSEIKDFIHEVKPSIWFQHAAWTKDANSITFDIEKAISINVSPLDTIFKELRECQAKGIVVTGTNAEYGDSPEAVLESDACIPETLYGLSKLSSTIRARQLAKHHGVPTRIARVFNPIGKLDNPNKLLPIVIKSLLNEEKISLSECTQERDFLYIQDLLIGFELVANDLSRGDIFDIFNLCSGNRLSVKSLLINIANIMNKDLSLLDFGRKNMRSGEPFISYGNNHKARDILGWNANNILTNLDTVVNEIILEIGCNNDK